MPNRKHRDIRGSRDRGRRMEGSTESTSNGLHNHNESIATTAEPTLPMRTTNHINFLDQNFNALHISYTHVPDDGINTRNIVPSDGCPQPAVEPPYPISWHDSFPANQDLPDISIRTETRNRNRNNHGVVREATRSTEGRYHPALLPYPFEHDINVADEVALYSRHHSSQYGGAYESQRTERGNTSVIADEELGNHTSNLTNHLFVDPVASGSYLYPTSISESDHALINSSDFEYQYIGEDGQDLSASEEISDSYHQQIEETENTWVVVDEQSIPEAPKTFLGGWK